MKGRLKNIIPALAAIILFFGVIPAHAHLFWVETDADAVGSSGGEVRVFLGHPNMPDTNIVPELAYAKVHGPDGKIVALVMEKGADHRKGTVSVNQEGVYVVKTAREPGIFDPKWHDLKGPARRTKDFGELIMINGSVPPKPQLNPSMDLEIVPLNLPHVLRKGDVFKAEVHLKGKPVRADYAAADASANMHDPEAVQAGIAGADGRFAVNLDKEGMWVVMVEYGVHEAGVWDASHDLIYKGRTYYKKGEKLPYGVVKYRSTLTFHVGGK